MEEEKYYPWEAREVEFEEITFNNNPELVTDVSKLRHYVNCHGKKKIAEWLGLTKSQLSQVIEWCAGRTTIDEVRNNFETLVMERKEEERRRQEAKQKNRELVKRLSLMRDSMCGIGTRKVKLYLNKLIKQGDKVAELYRIALETEDYNIKAKDTNPFYQDKVYRKKHEYILKLANLCKEMVVPFGWQPSDVMGVNSVVYFELPGMEQISFHAELDEEEKKLIPMYSGEWDGKRLSTLWKMEVAIKRRFLDKIG